MYTQEMLIGIGIACVLAGIVLGLVIGRFLLRSKHSATLERELSEAQEAMQVYKNEVFQQFGDTARKFEKLNESYADLHKQLATSASVLCADMPEVPLLASSTVPGLQSSEDTHEDTTQDSPASTDADEPAENDVAVETLKAEEVVEPTTEAVANKPVAP